MLDIPATGGYATAVTPVLRGLPVDGAQQIYKCYELRSVIGWRWLWDIYSVRDARISQKLVCCFDRAHSELNSRTLTPL
jgi:hypothetical protein